MKITVIVPVFNERESLAALAEGVAGSVGPHEYRILFVDDGSTDGSFEVMRALRDRYDTIDIIRFRANFGKSAALAAGFAKAEGDVVFTMDADLQDEPKEIPRFLDKLDEGYDVVAGWKRQRQDPWHKTIPSQVYNGVVARVFRLPLHDVNCGFKAYRAEVVKNVRVYGELHRLIPVLAARLGYRVGEIPVSHQPRRFGKSKYGPERFTRGAMDVLSVWFLTRHRHCPGHFFGNIGFAAVGLGIFGLVCGAGAVLTGATVPGALAGLAGVGLTMGGLLTLGLGLIAELVIRQHPHIHLDRYIAEQHFGKPKR
jgi:glycosyltransferase involved in cell wall biosynthesis